MSTPSHELLRDVVTLACRAPSVHNSQPWLWRIVDDTVELYADRTRQLPVADPDGRNLAISCGAALHHAQEAAKALGLSTKVEELPLGSVRHELLARIEFTAGHPSPDAADRLRTLEQRCTDRRRFTSWPVPDATVTKLAEAASGWGGYAVPVTDVTARFRAELLMDRAMTVQSSDPRFADEQAGWVDHGGRDGVPSASARPTRTRGRVERPNRFLPEAGGTDAPRAVESSDGLVAICTGHDNQISWLQSGQTLSALWLQATRTGLSVVPLSQVIEVPETRLSLHEDVFAGMAHPQLLLRIGWQEIARATLPRTPRRSVDDVLMR